LLPLVVGLFGFVAFWVIRRRRRAGAVRKAALNELSAIQQDPALSASGRVQRISILIRRVALSLFPRAEVAPLNGRQWLEWLDRPLGDGRFLEGPGRVLDDGPYRPQPGDHADLDALLALCRDWLRALPSRR
jgi:hypothetical protein